MAVWQYSGVLWNSGMVPLCESDFVCVDDKYYLNSNYAAKEKETLQNAKEVWLKGEHPRSLHILTFPAYCRYRALKKRLLSGMCFARAQLVALGGVIAEHRSSRVLFCRDSFHHPYLDKFELSGDNKGMSHTNIIIMFLKIIYPTDNLFQMYLQSLQCAEWRSGEMTFWSNNPLGPCRCTSPSPIMKHQQIKL